MIEEPEKWNNIYTIVLLANLIYILAFYFITKILN